MRVELARDADQAYRGTLVLREPDGSETTRTVDGTRCDQVAAALALVAALALDPAGRPAASEAPPAPSRPATATVTVRRKAQIAAPPPVSWTLAAGAQLALLSGIGPDAVAALPVFVELRARLHALGDSGLRLAFVYAVDEEAIGAAAVSFKWSVARLDLSPLRLELGTLALEPVARLHAGVLTARSESVDTPRDVSRPWLDLGLLLRLRWAVIARLFIEIEGGGAAPLLRDRFLLGPNTTVHRAPKTTYAFAVGSGWSFW